MDKRGGGAALYIKDSITCFRVSDMSKATFRKLPYVMHCQSLWESPLKLVALASRLLSPFQVQSPPSGLPRCSDAPYPWQGKWVARSEARSGSPHGGAQVWELAPRQWLGAEALGPVCLLSFGHIAPHNNGGTKRPK